MKTKANNAAQFTLKLARNPARVANLRRLSGVIARGVISDDDQLAVIMALDNFADLLAGPKKASRPKTAKGNEQRFLQLTCLLFHEQPPLWRKNKGMPGARALARALTGWKLPARSRQYSEREQAFASMVTSKDEAELTKSKLAVVTWLPEDKREAVAAALGLRKKQRRFCAVTFAHSIVVSRG